VPSPALTTRSRGRSAPDRTGGEGPDASARAARSRELVGPFGGRALRVARLFGIDIAIDLSWILVFLLVTLSLAHGFAEGLEGLGPGSIWLAALVASGLFFASILLHEFGHSLTSNALGLPVRSITLFVFGGMARLSGEPERPRDELLIAAAGPLVSLALGGSFLLLSSLFSGGETPGATSVVFGWLGTVNIALALFNLVPGFPLDGGRILRAAVWRATGDFDRATSVAAAAGSAFAFALIAAGLVLGIFGGGLVNGLWLAFIGWFLWNAARSNELQVVLRRYLSELGVEPLMAPLEPRVDAEASVARAIEDVVLKHGRRTFFVVDPDGPLGMVTLHELVAVPPEERERTRVGSIRLAPSELVTVPVGASLWTALERMTEAGVSQLPVERDGRLVGVLTRERLLAVVQSARELGRAR
jgi:Zn-dependent protease/CBS domain-containing protein